MLTAGRLNFSSALHGAGHMLHMLYIRIKHTNLPLLVVFASALFMFVRALSGAGYTYAPPDAPPSTLTLEQTSDTEPMLANAYAGFEDQWTRFKEALLSCPDEINDNGEAGVIDVGAAPAAGDAKTRTRVGVACLGERLSGAISRSRSSVNAPAFAKEDRTFGLSLDGIPSRRTGDDHQERSNAEYTKKDEETHLVTRRRRMHGRL